jgi:hypothetical protein
MDEVCSVAQTGTARRPKVVPRQMVFGDRFVKMKLIEQPDLGPLQTAHHRSTPSPFASTRRNHRSRHVSTDFWQQNRHEADDRLSSKHVSCWTRSQHCPFLHDDIRSKQRRRSRKRCVASSRDQPAHQMANGRSGCKTAHKRWNAGSFSRGCRGAGDSSGLACCSPSRSQEGSC